MFSVPPLKYTLPLPAFILSDTCVIDSNPLAQLRCTVYAGTLLGTPDLSAITLVIFAVSAGWQTHPITLSFIILGSMSIFANSAFVAETPRSAADVFANVVPILQKGVRVPSTRYTFLFITVT